MITPRPATTVMDRLNFRLGSPSDTQSGGGPCAGLQPPQIVPKIVNDATTYAGAHQEVGFIGDPEHPIADHHYGTLVWASNY